MKPLVAILLITTFLVCGTEAVLNLSGIVVLLATIKIVDLIFDDFNV